MARAVTLIVETGAIVANSNSFVSEQQIVDYAAARGVALPFTTDLEKDAVAVLGIQAMDYMWVLPWKGELVQPEVQTTPWPRKNMNTTPSFPEDAIPTAVIAAQLMLALLSKQGVVLLPTGLGTGYLIKEKIGPIENVYSEKTGVSFNGMPILPGVMGLLDFWLLGDFIGFTPVMMWSIGDRSYDG